jgi:hypothetical protein
VQRQFPTHHQPWLHHAFLGCSGLSVKVVPLRWNDTVGNLRMERQPGIELANIFKAYLRRETNLGRDKGRKRSACNETHLDDYRVVSVELPAQISTVP